MSKEKFTFEQLAILVDATAIRHDLSMCGWSDRGDFFIAYFHQDQMLTSDFIVELQTKLGLIFLIEHGEKYLTLAIRP